jgi:hypothetical protein
LVAVELAEFTHPVSLEMEVTLFLAQLRQLVEVEEGKALLELQLTLTVETEAQVAALLMTGQPM